MKNGGVGESARTTKTESPSPSDGAADGGWPLPATGLSMWGFIIAGGVTMLGGIALLVWAKRLS